MSYTIVKFHGERQWTALFKSIHRFSIGFMSGLRPSRTCILLSLSHCVVLLSVCLGCLDLPIFSFLAEGCQFSLRILVYLTAPIFATILTNFLQSCPIHNAATTILHSEYYVFWMVCCVYFTQNIGLGEKGFESVYDIFSEKLLFCHPALRVIFV